MLTGVLEGDLVTNAGEDSAARLRAGEDDGAADGVGGTRCPSCASADEPPVVARRGLAGECAGRDPQQHANRLLEDVGRDDVVFD